jgi:hypothetical protein
MAFLADTAEVDDPMLTQNFATTRPTLPSGPDLRSTAADLNIQVGHI